MQEKPIKSNSELTESDWRRYSVEWEHSGESQPAFCRRHQISYSAFGYWRMKFNKQKQPAKQGGFSAIQLPTTQPASGNVIRLTLPNGINVMVPGNADKQLVAEVFKLLGVS